MFWVAVLLCEPVEKVRSDSTKVNPGLEVPQISWLDLLSQYQRQFGMVTARRPAPDQNLAQRGPINWSACACLPLYLKSGHKSSNPWAATARDLGILAAPLWVVSWAFLAITNIACSAETEKQVESLAHFAWRTALQNLISRCM